ncbi:MAG: hypothetical protein Q7S40_03920 [Opitutaceae bacterium]|nr:hypothetical protein [Opitutaceae bacterium]
MATRFVNIDRDTTLLPPPDLREWVPANHVRARQRFGTSKPLRSVPAPPMFAASFLP